MATRSEKGAAVAGAIVAAATVGVVVYNALKPILAGEDPWLIAGIAGGAVVVLGLVVFVYIRLHRRGMASRIKRR